MKYYIRDGEYYANSEAASGEEITKEAFDAQLTTTRALIRAIPEATYALAVDKIDFIAKHLGLI